MRTRLAVAAGSVLLSTVALSGCSSDAKQAVQNAAGGIATSAASKAAEAAQSAARQQICSIASDGQISASESSRLSAAVDAAERAGVPTSITGPARTVADAGATPPADAVNRIKQECARTQ